MAALNVDTDGFRRTGELVDLAGTLLGTDFDDPTPTPACASDPASETIMRNLNARQEWLLGHVRTGSQQAASAASGMNDAAASYETGDREGASYYTQFGGNSGGGGAPTATMNAAAPTAAAAPAMPTFDPIPDVSGTEGESLAMQLEAGAGPGPAVATAARLSTLAARAAAANATLLDAHTQLLATGESQATPGMADKLAKGIAFTEAVAGHASALAGGYESAGNLHTLTYSQVGPSAEWGGLKTELANFQALNAGTGGAYQPVVDAYQQTLDDKEQLKGVAATGLQTGGEVVSTPPGDLVDPGMDPNGDGQPDEKKDKKGADDKNPDAATDDLASSSGMQDMLQPLMGALGPLTQSLGKANPLQSVGQLAQQLGQQVGKLGGDAAKKAAHPLNPAALAKPLAGAGKGAGGGGGGGSPIKPSSNLPAATHPASLAGSPAATPSGTAAPLKAATAVPAGSNSTGGGMMPMGHRPGGDGKTSKINSYEEPLAEVESTGRPGVVGEAPKPAPPVVNPDAQNAVKARLARRKKDAAGDGDE